MGKRKLTFIHACCLFLLVLLIEFIFKKTLPFLFYSTAGKIVIRMFSLGLITLLSFKFYSFYNNNLNNGVPKENYNKGDIIFLFLAILLINYVVLYLELYHRLGAIDFFSSFNNDRGMPENTFRSLTVAPIFEELFFRGVLLNGMLIVYSKRISIFLSSLLFSIGHYSTNANSYSLLAFSFILGLYLGWVFVKTQDIKFLILLHFIWNFTTIIKIFFFLVFDIHLFDNVDFFILLLALSIMSAILTFYSRKTLRNFIKIPQILI